MGERMTGDGAVKLQVSGTMVPVMRFHALFPRALN